MTIKSIMHMNTDNVTADFLQPYTLHSLTCWSRF